MRIKKIEIEGFKSYSQRELVDKLDVEFNAITGLNGSGKSNILDAICFLLGITNLQQVRAHSLNDLVYKQGQAGINRATVTITFDNNLPPEQQPAGYERYKEIVVRRQIIINGRNTYQINGMAATNTRVSDLFRVVGINVNNPHFLIMQGRITKVLNMKPMEILSMIEEAAGVRMYEVKKQSALRTIEKKESKVQEISRLIDEDIHPRVDKLQRDRANYLEYQRLEREMEVCERKLFAYDYHNSKLQSAELERKAAAHEQEVRKIADDIDELHEQVRTEQDNMKTMEAEKNKNMSQELKRLDEQLRNLQGEQAQIESERDGKQSNRSELQTSIGRKQKSLDSDKRELAKKRTQLEKAESEIGGEEQRGRNAEEAVTRARQKLEALARGMTTDEQGNAVTLEAKLMATRTQFSEHQTNVQKARMRLEQAEGALRRKQAELATLSRRSGNQQDSKRELEAEIAQIEQHIRAMAFDPQQEHRLELERRELVTERDQLTNELDRFEDKHYNLQFKYRDPHRDFDRNRVKGVVAKLFRVRDPKFATALEVAAGGKLYNVVVDRAETAKQLLQSGLARRVTIIPLDKISSGTIDHRRIQAAKRMVGEENVFLAQELIDYDPELEPAIRSIFGNCLVCTNMDQAKRLAFDRAVQCRTVTLDGEDFRSAGVLSGGSRDQRAGILQALHNTQGSYARRNALVQRLDTIEKELARLRPLQKQFEQLNTQLGTQRKRLEAVEQALKHSPAEVLREECTQLEVEIAEANNTVNQSSAEMDTLSTRLRELEEQKKNEKGFQEREKKKAEKDLKDAQKELEQLKGTFTGIKESLATLRDEIASLEQTVGTDSEELEEMRLRMEGWSAEIEESDAAAAQAKERVNKAQAELDSYNKELRSHDKVVRAKAAQIEEMKKRARQLENKRESRERDAAEAAKQSTDFAKRAVQLEKVNKWIAEEKENFGVSGGVYDFQQYSYEIGKRDLEKRRDRSKALQQTINTKAMHLLGTAEEQLQELARKREQLVKDKAQLYDAIEKLDQKKRKELQAAHLQISGDFGSIYSTLLPGASAELVPPAGNENCLQGLEVKVSFNGKCKDSLTELSGGQRSLVALSLILAMLKFKPAPFYILDEIDAALDISHTENIGKMIKHHFSQSQFIVVSLKQGFFDNANVVYRVNFRDGRSTITRTENQH